MFMQRHIVAHGFNIYNLVSFVLLSPQCAKFELILAKKFIINNLNWLSRTTLQNLFSYRDFSRSVLILAFLEFTIMSKIYFCTRKRGLYA